MRSSSPPTPVMSPTSANTRPARPGEGGERLVQESSTAHDFVVSGPEGQVERPTPAGLVVIAVTRHAIGAGSVRRLDRRVMAFAALPDGWHQHVISLGARPRKHVARGAVFSDHP